MGIVTIFSKPKSGHIFWHMIWHMVWPHDRIFEIKMSWKIQDMWLPWQWGAIGRLWAMKRQGRIGKHGKLFCQWCAGQFGINQRGRPKRQEEINFTNPSVKMCKWQSWVILILKKLPHSLQEIWRSLWCTRMWSKRGVLDKNFVGMSLAPMVVPYFLSVSQGLT